MPPSKDTFLLVARYSWILFIFMTCVQGWMWWLRGRRETARDPNLEAGYQRLVKGWLICANLPWLIMGFGLMIGGVPTIFHFFNPRNGPFVLAFFLSIVVLWAVGFQWLFFRDGAEQIAAHPGLLSIPSGNPVVVKFFAVLMLAGGIAGLAMMVLGDLPPPALFDTLQSR